MDEIKRQGIENYEFWESVYLSSVKASINAAHRQIVEYAMVAGFEEVCIAEDDFIGTHENSWKFFLEHKPDDFDIYLSSVFMGVLDGSNCVKEFTAPTLYIVNRRFYENFLSVNPDEHIDHELSKLGGKYVVCNPFTFIQRDGISSNTGKFETYGIFFRDRKLYCG